MSRTDEIAARHVETAPSHYLGRPRHGSQCSTDQESWPCDAAVLLEEVGRLRAALDDTITTAERFCVWLNTMPGTTCAYDPSPARALLEGQS
jgi:hypothetical protein